MALLLTLDASVFVAACRPQEPGHEASRALLAALREAETPLIEPAILPVEVAAALCRAGEDMALAQEYAEAILSLPHLTVAVVDDRLARRALALTTQCRSRGADALYVTVASQYGARLVTLDVEQLDRSPPLLLACKPDAAVHLLRSAKKKRAHENRPRIR
jgi:predicted nucleic acid-binding protein